MILVTGATGLLGSHVVKTLIERGERPRALARTLSRRSYLGTLLATLPPGKVDFSPVDLSLGPPPRSIFDGITTVIHCAALASPFPADLERMRALNVKGTQTLYESALQAGVSAWVQISTVATLCDGEAGSESARPRSETDLGRVRPTGYAATKYEADQWLESRDDSLRKLTIHPCYMLDEWDARPSSGAILFALKMGKFTHFVNRIKNFVAARDVAHAVIAGVELERSGHFVIGGENIPLRDFFRVAAEELKLDPTSPLLPRELESFEEISDPLALEFCRSSAIDCSKAAQELVYQPTLGLREMIRATLDYFSRSRMLRESTQGPGGKS